MAENDCWPSVDVPDSSDKATTATLTEAGWEQLEVHLKQSLKTYEQARDRAEIERLQGTILRLMQALAKVHPEARERRQYDAKAKEFQRAPDARKAGILVVEIGRGLGLLIASPFFIVGGALYGFGLVFRGAANLVTGGAIGKLVARK
ncbi:hypothetical protein GGX14DRAFT_427291 [Mycena pura]|uniref:Uncharacterized protein n=1 Tax=Mycena pura TaxID=153505 RepID=A0AAD6YLZ2_9AGAR|nr:hypothetical protein GGX14DRAFT_427291 [Mycena pura]